MMKTATKKRAALKKRGPHLVDSSMIPPEMQQVNPRVGVHPGEHLMATSFRHSLATPEMIEGVRECYRNRWFSQKSIAQMFDLPIGLVAKMVRTDPYWRK